MSSLTAHALHSLVTSDGRLKLSIDEAAVPVPGADEVVVRIDAAPLNPSDILNLLGAADIATLRAVGGPGAPAAEADVPKARLAGLVGRLDRPVPGGNEGGVSWCKRERPRKLCSGARWRSRLSGEATRLTRQ
jgi:NADPH:quinone reductase